ncbi:MAG: ATP synthase F0 subunit B [Acidobacteria bacterium]|nr:ATP synthase F0 subunit B [Acidobacteriota bacterium]
MRRHVWISILLALCPIALLAAEGEGHEAASGNGWLSPIWGVPVIAWQIANLLLVIALFVYLLRKPAPKFFKDRSLAIEEQLTKALREKEEALARLKEVEAKMATLSEEIAAIEREARLTAEKEKERIKQEADQMRERIRRETEEEASRQLEEARRSLRAYAAELAEQTAREIVSKNITASDEERLREKFFAGMTRALK